MKSSFLIMLFAVTAQADGAKDAFDNAWAASGKRIDLGTAIKARKYLPTNRLGELRSKDITAEVVMDLTYNSTKRVYTVELNGFTKIGKYPVQGWFTQTPTVCYQGVKPGLCGANGLVRTFNVAAPEASTDGAKAIATLRYVKEGSTHMPAYVTYEFNSDIDQSWGLYEIKSVDIYGADGLKLFTVGGK